MDDRRKFSALEVSTSLVQSSRKILEPVKDTPPVQLQLHERKVLYCNTVVRYHRFCTVSTGI